MDHTATLPRRAEDWNDWDGMVDRMRRAIGARHDGHPKRPAPRRAMDCWEHELLSLHPTIRHDACEGGLHVRYYRKRDPRRADETEVAS